MYTAENVACEGCRSKGEKVADKQCKARPCAREKGLESCAQCDEFPCEKVRSLITHPANMLTYNFNRFKDLTEEEYDLCIRQWNSMPNLIQTLVDEGKLPSFVVKKVK
jgi:hypothetical protein